MFLVDHIAATIEQKQVVKLDGVRSHKVYGIHARGNNIVCFYDHGHGWGIIVSELGPGPALKHFNLAVNGVRSPLREVPLETYMRCRIRTRQTFNSSRYLRTPWLCVM